MAGPVRWILVVLLALGAGAAAYLASRAWLAPESPAAVAPPPETPASVIPERRPDVTLADRDGRLRSLSEWDGRPQIINFWATWCAPCREEMPLLEQVHQERRDRGLTVIGIAIDREEPVRTFVGEIGVSYPILVGQMDATAAAEAFGPDFVGLPLTAFAAPGGEILRLHVGQVHAPDLAAFLDVIDRLAAGQLTIPEARQALEKT